MLRNVGNRTVRGLAGVCGPAPAGAASRAMDLQSYLERIGFVGPASPDIDTLKAVHHRHLLGITYENLSVHLEIGRAHV